MQPSAASDKRERERRRSIARFNGLFLSKLLHFKRLPTYHAATTVADVFLHHPLVYFPFHPSLSLSFFYIFSFYVSLSFFYIISFYLSLSLSLSFFYIISFYLSLFLLLLHYLILSISLFLFSLSPTLSFTVE